MIAVTYTEPTLRSQANAIAETLGLPLTDNTSDARFDLLIAIMPSHIALIEPQNKVSRPFYIDYLSQQTQNRIKRANSGNELLFKAVGLKKNETPSIIDATAGFGEDAYLLASQGCGVTLLERSPIMALLLEDALKRLYENVIYQRGEQTGAQENSITLYHVDSIHYLKQLQESKCPDVIYLDPMYPIKQKSALNKKSMRLLRDIVGNDEDTAELSAVAFAKARKRVVIKRPRLAVTATDTKPDIVFKGKAIRFDVYI